MQAIQIKKNQDNLQITDSIKEEIARQVQLATAALQEQINKLEEKVETLQNQLSEKSVNNKPVKQQKVKEPTLNELKNKARGMGVLDSEARKIGRLTLKSTWIKAIQEREEFDKQEALSNSTHMKQPLEKKEERNNVIKLIKSVEKTEQAVDNKDYISSMCLNPFSDEVINSLMKEFELDRCYDSATTNELPF